MDDQELRRRMKAADPARTNSTPDSWLPDLLEETITTARGPRVRRRRWQPMVAAAALVTAIGTGVVLSQDAQHAQDAQDPGTDRTTVTLAMPEIGTSMSSCIQFDTRILADMTLAFSGTAADVADDTVTLQVDRWYRGGKADVVVLNHYDAQTASIDGIEFIEGSPYLITATNGTVNFCGYSTPWSQDMADKFQQAFGS
jgi:hypothetical protein